MNTKNIFIVTFIVATLLLSGCAAGKATQQQQVVNIGVISALTGPVNSVSGPSQNAIRIAAHEWNADPSHRTKFNVIFEDTQGKAPQSVNAFNKLVNSDNVAAVVTGISMTTMTIAPLAERIQIPAVAFVSTTTGIREAGEYVYRTSPMNIKGLTLTSDYMLKNKQSNIAVLTELYDYPISLKKVFEQDFKNKGGRIISSQEFSASEDLRSVITKAMRNNPDALVLFVQTPITAVNLLKQLKELGIQVPIYGNENIGNDMAIRLGKELVEDVIVGLPLYNNRKVEKLKSKYTNAIGNDHVLDWLYVATGYDAAWVLFESIEKVGTNGPAIKQQLDRVKNFGGYSGLESFDSKGDVALGKYSLFQIQNGQKVSIK